jgi:hypothetical protein
VHHPTSTTTSLVGSHPRTAIQADAPSHMIRGLVNGMVLSLAVWLAAGYVAFILR